MKWLVAFVILGIWISLIFNFQLFDLSKFSSSQVAGVSQNNPDSANNPQTNLSAKSENSKLDQKIVEEVESAKKIVQNSNLPTSSQHLAYIQTNLDQYKAKPDQNSAKNLSKQLDFVLKTTQEEKDIMQKNSIFDQIQANQTKIKDYSNYFESFNSSNSSQNFKEEKDLIKNLDLTIFSLYQQKLNPNYTSQQMEEVLKTQINPAIQTLVSSKKANEDAIIAQKIAEENERKRQEFLAKRAAQDSYNKSLNIQAPNSPLPNLDKMIFVSIQNQSMYSYEYGIPIQATPVVTGKPGFETVTGKFAIYKKERKAILNSPFEDIEYAVPVDYWMPFYSGYGIHDASWRGSFGGDIYQTRGSHGCVNTPANVAAWMFNWAEVGTTVVIS